MNRESKQYLVIGCGRFGSAVATSLEQLKKSVMIVDSNEEAINEIANKVTHSAIIDVADEEALLSIGLGNFDVVIIAIGGEFKASVMATLIAKETGVPTVICKASDEVQARVLRKIGADRVIMPEKDMGKRLAQNLVSSNVLDQIGLGETYAIFEIQVPRKWVAKTIGELDLRRRNHINVVAIKRAERIILNIGTDFIFAEDDIVVVACENGIIEQFANE